MTLDPEIRERVEAWLHPPFDQETIDEVQSLLDNNEEQELYERFYRNLEFGTGGLRGTIGAGLNRMNPYTVGRATQGLANYIRKNAGDDPSVVIGYDSRIKSDTFAQAAACVLAANGVRVHLFDSLRPVPLVSFGVRHLGATAGVMVTASHNPKEYNGYKVYWSDGGQIVPKYAEGIIDEILAIDDFGKIEKMEYERAVGKGMISSIGTEVDEAYYEAILPLSCRRQMCLDMGDKLHVVFTPLHGAGAYIVPEALERWGFRKIELEPSQKDPDGRFPTAPRPNPEEKEALTRAIDTARRDGADLVLGTDPDCDRVGIAVRVGGEMELLSGNQVAAMLVDYVLQAHAEQGTMPSDARVIKTIVTTELIASIAEHYGVEIENTLTGFKYIGEKILEYEQEGEGQYLVGGEESYGYLVGTHARDKDGVVSSCFIVEMTAHSMSQGQTLVDRLDGLFKRFGVHQESLLSMEFEGSVGQETITRIMRSLREDPPQELLGVPVVEIRDFKTGEVREMPSGEKTGETGLPESNVLLFRFSDGVQIVARPSGTEPKVKFYFMLRDLADLPIESDEELEQRKRKLDDHHDRLRAAFEQRVRQVAGE